MSSNSNNEKVKVKKKERYKDNFLPSVEVPDDVEEEKEPNPTGIEILKDDSSGEVTPL